MSNKPEQPPEWLRELPVGASRLLSANSAEYAGYRYYWNSPQGSLPEEFRVSGVWSRGRSRVEECLDEIREKFAELIDLTAVHQALVDAYSRITSQVNTFEQLRVQLIPIVSCYRMRSPSSGGNAVRNADMFLLTPDGKLHPDSAFHPIDQLLEDPIIFGTCDACSDPIYHDQLIQVGSEHFCLPCKTEHEKPDDQTVHGDSERAG